MQQLEFKTKTGLYLEFSEVVRSTNNGNKYRDAPILTQLVNSHSIGPISRICLILVMVL